MLASCTTVPEYSSIVAFYTDYGQIEILEVAKSTEYSGEMQDCISVKVNFINNTKDELYVSAENFQLLYEDEITDAATIEDAVDVLPPTSLNPNISTIGNIYFFVPVGTTEVRLECSTEKGIAIFYFEIKDN